MAVAQQPVRRATTSTGAASGTVSMWAQSRIVRAPLGPRDRASRLPGVGARLPGRVVLLDVQPELAEVGAHRVRHRALAARRALDLAEPDEVGDEAFALGGWRSDGGGHGLEELSARRAHARDSARTSGSSSGARPRAALERRAHEVPEQRLRAQRAGLELGVVLRGDEERVVGQLDDLHQAVVRRGAAADEARLLQPLAQVVVDLVAVAVALVDHRLAVDLARRACPRGASPGRRPGASCRPCRGPPSAPAGGRSPGTASPGRTRWSWRPSMPTTWRANSDTATCMPEADAEVRHLVLAREAGRADLALDAAHAEAAGNEDAVARLAAGARPRRRSSPSESTQRTSTWAPWW